MSEHQFKDTSFKQWQSAASAALRGKPLENLTKSTYDDIKVEPLYAASANPTPINLPSDVWQINQAINHPNIDAAKAQIAQDLEQGVNSLSLYSNQAQQAHGYGLDLTPTHLNSLFKDVYLNMVSLRLETGLDEFSTANAVTDFYNALPNKGQLSLGIDPIGKFAQFGGWNGEAKAKSSVISALPKFKAHHILRLDGRIAHNAGASEAQELNFILSTALTYLKWADEAGLNLNEIAPKFEISLSASQNQFITIAKIRAMRQLWAELLDGLEIKQCPAYIYAETSYRMMTKPDPWVNLLRTTVACFSAGVAGADQIGILPLSAAIGLAPAFDRRLARHIQTILIEESHLADVTDPSHGSGYIENLTKQLTIKSWELFQNTQRTGGIISNLLAGNVQRQIQNITSHRDQNLESKTHILTGTSEYAIEDEAEYETVKAPKTTLVIPDFEEQITPLLAKRDSEMFESPQGDV